jgi:hypothetical protein
MATVRSEADEQLRLLQVGNIYHDRDSVNLALEPGEEGFVPDSWLDTPEGQAVVNSGDLVVVSLDNPPGGGFILLGDTSGAIYSDNLGGSFTEADLGVEAIDIQPNRTNFGGEQIVEGERCIGIGYEIGIDALSTNAIAIGEGATIGGATDQAIAIGFFANALGDKDIAMGNVVTSGDGYDIAIGDGCYAAGLAIAIGMNNTNAEAGGVAIGDTTEAAGIDSVAIGTGAYSDEQNCVAIGQGAEAYVGDSVAVGYNALADDDECVAIGPQAHAQGEQSIAISNVIAGGFGSVVIGRGSSTDGDECTVVGYNSWVPFPHINASVFGASATAQEDNATAIGHDAAVAAGHTKSTALGADAATTAANQVMLGTATETVVAPGSASIAGAAGSLGFFGTTPTARQTGYTTFTNLSTDRTCDANATTVDELADILGTLIEDLKTLGLIAA